MPRAQAAQASPPDDPAAYLPPELRALKYTQGLIPAIAKDRHLVRAVEDAARRFPTRHTLHCTDARELLGIPDGSVHLVLTSPPYWTLKEYDHAPGQMGHIAEYEAFLSELDRVWRICHRALAPGGRVVCVVGDVCLSRRRNEGVHEVVPLHASIQERCRALGFTNLAPIIWHKIANAAYEAGGNGGFLGKPYEPNAVIKNDIEFILLERKPGGYRAPSVPTRLLSVIPEEHHRVWFRQIWTGITGASTRSHPAPFPIELAERLIRMFSFVGDTVLDPFMGTGTTNVAAARWGRHSIGVEVSKAYFDGAAKRIERECRGLFCASEVVLHAAPA